MIVLLKNGRRKEEAKNELKIFLADDSDSFVSWYANDYCPYLKSLCGNLNSVGGFFFYRLWDHLGESVDEYFTSSHVEKTNMRSSLVSSLNEDKALVQMDSESEKGRAPSRRSRQWRTQPNASDVPPLLSSEVHKVHNYEKEDHRERHGKRSPSEQSHSHRKRSKIDSSRNEQVCIL